MSLKINFITLCCYKNKVDTEYLLQQCQANGYTIDFENYTDKFDIVIINTCGFIFDAKQESINVILQFIQEKKQGNIDKVIVFGCLTQRYKEEITKELPEIDAIFGVDAIKEILEYLNANYNPAIYYKRILTTPKHFAFLKISEGCNRKCSFCAIPAIRGKLKSKPVEELIKEAEYIAKQGAKELILIAQDLTTYGIDIYSQNKLDYLLNKIAEINGIEWIRLHYAYPANFPLDILKTIASNDKFCKYIDIPIQHISDDILKSMQRGIYKEKTKKLLYTIRDKVPDVAIRSTLIVGYPTETDEHFKELYDFVKEFRFERLGVFPYSPEEGTKAYSLKQINSKRVIKNRVDRIMKLQEEISAEINQKKINQKLKVLIDSKEENYYIARTEFDSPEIDNEVFVNTKKKLNIGKFYNVTIYEANNFELFAKI